MNKDFNLLEEIRTFSQSKFDKVYTKTFLKHIIFPSYNPKKKSFCIVYCDFDRLNDINTIYSPKVGDKLLANTYSKIHTILEQSLKKADYSISLLGGDEFLILIHSMEREKIVTCFDKISSIVRSDSISAIEKIYDCNNVKNHVPQFVDFSYGITFSNEKDYESIYEMLHDAEAKQVHSKIFLQASEMDFYTALEAYSNHCIFNFFKNYRFHNYLHFDISDNLKEHKKDIRNLLLLSIHSLLKLVNKPEEVSALITKLKNINPVPFEKSSSHFSEEQCSQIYSYLQKDFSNTTSSFNPKELSSLLNILIREAVSGCYNRLYFQKYFTNFFENSDFTFSTAILIDTTNMKISNLQQGHSATDKKIKTFSDNLQKYFENVTHLPFSQNNFAVPDHHNFIFDFGGGNYFILCKNFVDYKTISETLFQSIQGCEPLGFSYSSDNITGMKNLSSIVEKLYKNCHQKKLSAKNNSLDFCDNSIVSTFKMFLAPTIEFYLKNNPCNPLDIQELKKLSDTLANSIMTYAAKYLSYTSYNIDSSSKEYSRT